MPVGVDGTQAEFNAVEKTGGAKTHSLTLAELASHNHGGATGINSANHQHDADHNHTSTSMPGPAPSSGGTTSAHVRGKGDLTPTTSGGMVETKVMKTAIESTNHTHVVPSAGTGAAHNNLPPYITLYMWKRTA